jgi:hypothetical protein
MQCFLSAMELATQLGVSVLGPERLWINLTGGTGVRFSSGVVMPITLTGLLLM